MFQKLPDFLAILALALILFWSLPVAWQRARPYLLIVASFLAIKTASDVAFWFCLGVSVTTYIFARLLARDRGPRLFALSLVVFSAVMLLPDFITLQSGQPFIVVGLAYFTIKSVAILFDASRGQFNGKLRDVLLLNAFFPIFSSGPIERIDTFASINWMEMKASWKQMAYGAYRIAFGAVKMLYISSVFLLDIQTEYLAVATLDSAGVALAYILLNWLRLYIAFSGYSDIAVGASLLFGIRVLENFNSPFLAASIQEYWQRWHLSLSRFISHYLYRGIVRKTGRIYLGLVLTFLIVGMWHKVSPTYLMWGSLHGLALAGYMYYSKFLKPRIENQNLFTSLWYRVTMGCVTMVFVAWVSTFATANNIAESIQITKALAGLNQPSH